MLKFDKGNFEAEVLQGEGVVLVDFYSPKCEPCQELLPQVEALAEKYGDKIKFGKLDISENRRLAIGQRVMGLPTILLYKDGEKLVTLTGDDLTAEEIEVEVKKLV